MHVQRYFCVIIKSSARTRRHARAQRNRAAKHRGARVAVTPPNDRHFRWLRLSGAENSTNRKDSGYSRAKGFQSGAERVQRPWRRGYGPAPRVADQLYQRAAECCRPMGVSRNVETGIDVEHV